MFADGSVIDQKYYVRRLCSNAGGMGSLNYFVKLAVPTVRPANETSHHLALEHMNRR